MDIEEFYEANEKRRDSAEFEFGSDWTDAAGNSYELSWVEDTGELYLMLGPDVAVGQDPFGDFAVVPEEVSELHVVVIATVPTLEKLLFSLEDWEEAMGQPDSLKWLHGKFGAQS